VTQFAVCGVLATVLIGMIAVAVSRHIGTDEAIGHAKQVTRLAAEGIIEPQLDDAVMRGEPRALRRLDRVVRRGVLGHGLMRVKIWSPDGRVIYSDERRLIGRHFDLEPEERAALLRRGDVHAQVSTLEGPENRFERRESKLLEVYVPIHDHRGRPLAFEAYQRFSAVAATGRGLWLAFAPALLGGLGLLFLITLPLGRGLARRLREAQQEREALLRRALDASESERRLIAADLHDGIVQDLVGASYTLEAEVERLDGDADQQLRGALEHGAVTTRRTARALRTMLVDIYPAALEAEGLQAALGALARTYTARGIHTTVKAPDALSLDPGTERLLFRSAQEALRNVQKHAHARSAEIAVRRAGDRIRLEVRDDGSGCDGDVALRPQRDGHVGLRLLNALVRDAGGQLEVVPNPRGGTILSVDLG
jgi:two-component system NarL family sensor kinase